MTAAAPMTADLAEDEFMIARTFEAPCSQVFEAWTDPRLIVRWWGPRAFTNPVCELDPEAGGSWRIVMRSPEGVEYPVKGDYREVVVPERIVLTMDCSEHPPEWHDLVDPNRGAGENNPAGEMVSLVTFDEHEEGTTLTIRTRFETPEIRDAMLDMGMTDGWSQSLERLDALLSADREILTTRLIDAPREIVFQAFIEPEHLAQWWGPSGFTNTFHEFDPQPGGHWRFIMHGPEGADYPNHSIFDEVVLSERVVFRHLDPIHNFQMTMLFTEECGKTRLTWRMRHETPARCEAVKSFVTVANEQNLDRLEAKLAKMKTEAH